MTRDAITWARPPSTADGACVAGAVYTDAYVVSSIRGTYCANDAKTGGAVHLVGAGGAVSGWSHDLHNNFFVENTATGEGGAVSGIACSISACARAGSR